jgi:mono/diheme cytochrome c family protein
MSRRSGRAAAVVAALLSVAVAGCGGGGGQARGGGMMRGSGGMMSGARAGETAPSPTTTAKGVGTQADDGRTLFLAGGCGSCHALAAAGTTGRVGPDLDQAKPSYSEVVERVTDGGGGMPAFSDSLTGPQIRVIAGYVADSVR